MTSFDTIVKNVLIKSGCSYDALISGYSAVRNSDLQTLNKVFSIAKKSKLTNKDQIADLINYMDEAFAYSVMTDYPYPTDFLRPLPAWPAHVGIPMKKVCSFLNDTTPSDTSNLLKRMAGAVNAFYQLKENCVRAEVCGDEAARFF